MSINLIDSKAALDRLNNVIAKTPLQYNVNLSRKYNAKIYLKWEDQQLVCSYKLRGAYNMISSLPTEQLSKGVVCDSAGNMRRALPIAAKSLVLMELFLCR